MKKCIEIKLDEAIKWYNSDNEELKAIALKAYSEDVLKLVSSYRNIINFKGACDTLGINYKNQVEMCDNLEYLSVSISAFYRLNIIKTALNLYRGIDLIEDKNLWYPCIDIELINENPESINYRERKIFKYNNRLYEITNTYAKQCQEPFPSNFTFLECTTKEIAEHFAKYFYDDLCMALFGDGKFIRIYR